MKVNQINPGIVKWNEAGTLFAYTLRYYGSGRTWEEGSGFDYASASAAKQAMRESLMQERKRHGVNK